MSKKFTGPKRRIERIRNRIDVLMGDDAAFIVLHAAEDAKTLVRTIVDLMFIHIGGTANEIDWNIMITRAESSIPVVDTAISLQLDAVAPIALIWEHSGTLGMETLAGNLPTKDAFADLKGMRKMKETDTIEFVTQASTSSFIRVVGTITLFFKE